MTWDIIIAGCALFFMVSTIMSEEAAREYYKRLSELQDQLIKRGLAEVKTGFDGRQQFMLKGKK